MESEFTEQDSLLLASLEEDEQQVGRVRDRINCCHLGTVELTDVLSNFPDVSLVLIEGKWRT
ncbi:hypothetical protein RHSIM_Rhsim02G0239300 [Rhododendron simsii]|uniref:Uncharacterized protein n=1 Tax=Rhododendron simsii TaxID=118357 RepID=A0A834H8S7_RHOSS|nr:hypothetical protein RHSIM_Rhsim02G0239300 [Rhododendron simsii]